MANQDLLSISEIGGSGQKTTEPIQIGSALFLKVIGNIFLNSSAVPLNIKMTEVQLQLLQEVDAYVEDFVKQQFPDEYSYHTYEHIQDVLRAINEIGSQFDLSEKDWELLMLAGQFHDLGYAGGPENHEERSVGLARDFLFARQYPEEDFAILEKLILATKMPQSPQNQLEAILCDADLSHIGSPIYWDRCAKVRQELVLVNHQIMTEHEWVDFELEFLSNHQFHTEVAQNLYDKRKEKHIKQLKKHKLRLNPEMADLVDEMESAAKKKKTKKGKLKKSLATSDKELKELNLGRGVETMFRTTYRTHVNLSSIADNKANIMLSINAIIISIVVTNLVPRFGEESELIFPTSVLLITCLVALVFAILATRPKVTEGKFTREDIENKRSNLLFFGNFYNMNIKDFHWGMMEMIKDKDFLYSSMTRDLYYLGVVLAKKYKLLRLCYNTFMYGLIISVLIFAAVFAGLIPSSSGL